MAPTIRIDDEVYAWLQGQGRAFEDTPNSVLRKLAKLDAPAAAQARTTTSAKETGERTPQKAYRAPILQVLAKHGGQGARMAVLKGVEKLLEKQLTAYDKAEIDSGTIRWEKSAEWEVRAMREAGLLKPVNDGPRGYWVLSKAGEAAARNV